MLSQISKFFSKLSIQPLGQRVVVQLNEAKKGKVGSLYVPETTQQEINEGTIVAVGPGKRVGCKTIPISVQVGQKVLLPKYGGQVVKIDRQEYTILSEEDILAVFK